MFIFNLGCDFLRRTLTLGHKKVRILIDSMPWNSIMGMVMTLRLQCMNFLQLKESHLTWLEQEILIDSHHGMELSTQHKHISMTTDATSKLIYARRCFVPFLIVHSILNLSLRSLQKTNDDRIRNVILSWPYLVTNHRGKNKIYYLEWRHGIGVYLIENKHFASSHISVDLLFMIITLTYDRLIIFRETARFLNCKL